MSYTPPVFAGPFVVCSRVKSTKQVKFMRCVNVNCGAKKEQDGKHCKNCGELLKNVPKQEPITLPHKSEIYQDFSKANLREDVLLSQNHCEGFEENVDIWIPANDRGGKIHSFRHHKEFDPNLNIMDEIKWFQIAFADYLRILHTHYPVIRYEWGFLSGVIL